MREIRCGHCKRLLAKGSVVEIEIKCPRCQTLNHVRAASPSTEGHGASAQEAPCARSLKTE
ncbi:Com family DNA-binding transcriptional regulator [Fundidesulfovibrio magnetotacticus]|uniref:Com family DNA-binding transcriptional regulator n=1 Tax=Fundidesulfovibrio magnetotacticus TaxID=2730080 RepID=UPI001566B129|nr:Com family DNA-binding transcriptional regulator [Fundidesulfovibrio magnetotacticus]